MNTIYRNLSVELFEDEIIGFGTAYHFHIKGEAPVKGWPKKVNRVFAFPTEVDRDDSFKPFIDWLIDHEDYVSVYLDKMHKGDQDTIDFLADKLSRVAFVLNNEITDVKNMSNSDNYHYQVIAAQALMLKAGKASSEEATMLLNKASKHINRATVMHKHSLKKR